MQFPILGLFIFILSLFSLLRKRSTRKQEEAEARFWSRELKANSVRRQDISGLPYISIPYGNFPIGKFQEEDILDYETDLKNLSNVKILNLTGESNTDLKLKYCPANLPELSECDQNFTRLARTLVSYGDCLIKHGYEAEALPVLEFGIECGSDISRNYSLLASIYEKNNNIDGIRDLREKANALPSLMKQSIVKHLDETLSRLT